MAHAPPTDITAFIAWHIKVMHMATPAMPTRLPVHARTVLAGVGGAVAAILKA